MEISGFISDFENLPKKAQAQVLEYIRFLMNKYPGKNRKNAKSFKFNWEGGLKELKNNYTSVELQHRINELR